ncbi:putative conserved hypothetical protein (pseudogene) [Streptococcus pneumoniae SPNA45]|nr:putative conserved hypothetical protein (pseudogene) [Streptococcus pneumoniae SPNA45]
MTSDKAGLERKFAAKERKRNKPGVVLCGSMDELCALAQLNPEIEAFYKHWDEDILLGCILPWKPEAFEKLKVYGDGREELMTDVRGTSCFVIKFGKAGEQLAAKLWEEGKMVYASSASNDKMIETRYEQGVMVSMVDKDGKLIPEQGGARLTSPAPVVIRKGLDIDKIMMHLSDTFNSWDYRQVEYY